ncbi:hypothetical protein SAMN05216464_109277 [Mucilaginibacter pineti]|uniref:Uncharacterized protein n=1 Tax=Mucilaginibacter pineti TaxID=1391627 RepID=A0A1G7FYN1_9SPHI|nr:hypothetical protein [Mucilaginibacter pineti]SDE80930.1 hypothetical protein SAMN05216464_109277 [Mucilaginibacter pineti]
MDCIYETESIDNNETLYYKVHKQYIISSKVIPNAFQTKGDGMSTDWARYCTPEETRLRNGIAKDNAIVSLHVGEVRIERNLEVVHKPEDFNRAHSLIKGIPIKDPFKTEVRRHLTKIHKVIIPLEIT